MFGFINDYIKKLGLKDEEFRLVLIDGKALCVQGFKSLLKIDESEIAIKTNTGEILIVGNNLNIKEFGGDEILIEGNILKIER